MKAVLPDEQVDSPKQAKGRLQPFQYGVGTLLAVVTAYGVLFGLLSWLQVRSAWAFLAIVVYLTAMVFGQWSLFDGRQPYWASSLVCGVFSVAAALVDLRFHWGGILILFIRIPAAFLSGAFLGILVGAVVDFILTFVEITLGVRREVFVPPTDPSPSSSRHAQANRWNCIIRWAILVLLAAVFCFSLFMGWLEGAPQ